MTIAHVLQNIVKVLVVPVHKNAAVATSVLRVPAIEIRIEERVRDAAHRLHRCLEAVATDVELDVAFLRLLHGCNLPQKLISSLVYICEPPGALLGHLGKSLGALLSDLEEPLGALEHPAAVSAPSSTRQHQRP
jgi:hypothetical protein